jgi:hypothetical protein
MSRNSVTRVRESIVTGVPAAASLRIFAIRRECGAALLSK